MLFFFSIEAMISPTVFKDGLRDINDQRPFRRAKNDGREFYLRE